MTAGGSHTLMYRWLEEPDEVAYSFLRIHERASRGGHWPPADCRKTMSLRGSAHTAVAIPLIFKHFRYLNQWLLLLSGGFPHQSADWFGMTTYIGAFLTRWGRPMAARFLCGFPKKMGGQWPPILCFGFSVYPTALIFSAVIVCQGMSMGVRPPNCSFSQAS